MRARDIFEKIGYKYSYVDGTVTNETPYIEYLVEEGMAWERIVFRLRSERVLISASTNGYGFPAPLSLEEIKAIELQCEELGWNV